MQSSEKIEMSKIEQTFDKLVNENVEAARNFGAQATDALNEMEASLKGISVEGKLQGSKDKVLIFASDTPGYVSYVRLGNPNRGGPYYNVNELAALKKAFNEAVDKAIDEVEKINDKYKTTIDKIMDQMKKNSGK